MPSRRRHRVAMLSPDDVETLEHDARLLFDSIRKALTKLVPFNESYSALYRLGDEMRGALNVIAGRPRDHVEPVAGPSAMPPAGVATEPSLDRGGTTGTGASGAD